MNVELRSQNKISMLNKRKRKRLTHVSPKKIPHKPCSTMGGMLTDPIEKWPSNDDQKGCVNADTKKNGGMPDPTNFFTSFTWYSAAERGKHIAIDRWYQHH